MGSDKSANSSPSGVLRFAGTVPPRLLYRLPATVAVPLLVPLPAMDRLPDLLPAVGVPACRYAPMGPGVQGYRSTQRLDSVPESLPA